MTTPIQEALLTQQTIRVMKGKKPIRRVRKFGRALSTRNQERNYRSAVRKARSRIFQLISDLLVSRLPELERAAGVRADGSQTRLDIDTWADVVRRIMGDIRSQLGDQVDLYNEIAQGSLEETSVQNLKSLRAQFRRALGVDVFVNDPQLEEVAKSWVSENASLIKNADDDLLQRVENSVFRGFRGGRRAGDIAEEIVKATGISQRRANLIAIDQVQKLNGQLTRNRQRNLGVNSYIWRTVIDERVRKEHRRREGRVFSWDDPPSDGHPGEPINCRCFAEPNIDDMLSESVNVANAMQ